MSRRPNSARALRNSCGGVETLRATASQCFSSGCGGTNTSIWAVFGWPLASRIGVPLHVTLPVAVRCRPHLARRSATPPGVHRIWHGILSNARDCETGVAKVLTVDGIDGIYPGRAQQPDIAQCIAMVGTWEVVSMQHAHAANALDCLHSHHERPPARLAWPSPTEMMVPDTTLVAST